MSDVQFIRLVQVFSALTYITILVFTLVGSVVGLMAISGGAWEGVVDWWQDRNWKSKVLVWFLTLLLLGSTITRIAIWVIYGIGMGE